jgi:cytochrome P450
MTSLVGVDTAKASGEAPGPRFATPFGFLAVMRRDPLRFLEECRRTYGDVVQIRFFLWRSFVFARPCDIRHILHENHRNYWKGVVFAKLKRIGGEGLVFSDGDLWRRQRQLVQPAFHRDRIAAMTSMMTDTTAALLDRWRVVAAAGQPVDVAAEMSRLTLGIVARALFGTALGEDEDDFRSAVSGGMEYSNHLVNHFFALPLAIPTRANRRGRHAIARLDAIVWKIIGERRRDVRDRGDLLSMLINARDAETNETMTDRQLRDEVVTFLVAGHETTAVALAWTWHLVAQHAAVERRLQAEVDTVLDGGRVPTLADLAELRYTRMVIEESMRLYPPVWGTMRQAYDDDVVGGQLVRKDETVTVSPWLTHRHPDLWERPEEFDPERFTADRSAARPDYAYFPFGGGPRRCIGNQFAMMEAQLILAMTVQAFRLQAVPGHSVEPDPILTLRPRHGVWMTLRPREPAANSSFAVA